ncbi:MAG TPA: FAD-dependent oxidoreductase [Actinomycetales bacterium]|nr:FAD-dependent oxidoreductase [Actinomycetales bacterium]
MDAASPPTTPRADCGTLVVGASQAGVQLVSSLRELGDDRSITLIGDEPHQPYQRPPLSKAFLAGDVEQDALSFRTPEYYGDHGISLVCGERVVTIEPPDADRPGRATTDTGRVITFSRLALTVGARPRRLSVPGADLDGVCYLRDVDDSARLRARLASAERVVVVGGGFIGLEAAAVARAQGKQVTVVEAAERLLGRAVADVVSDFYLHAHRRRGTAVALGAAAAAIEGVDGVVTSLETTDGRSYPADLVLVGVGVEPRTELAQQLGLTCDGGIVVDAGCRTNHPHVVAAGDCTVQPHPLTGKGRVRLESVQNAVSQARCAAATLLGLPSNPAVPWFWSDQADLKLQIAGLNLGYDEVVLRGEPATERFSALYYGHGHLLAVDAVNRPTDYMAVRKALTTGADIPPELAKDDSTPLKSLLAPATLAG